MKVYTVTFQRFENSPPVVLGICSTREKAESFLPKSENNRYWWDMEEFELDGLIEEPKSQG